MSLILSCFVFMTSTIQLLQSSVDLDLTRCQETGEIRSLYRKPRFNEFLGKQAKCSLCPGIVHY